MHFAISQRMHRGLEYGHDILIKQGFSQQHWFKPMEWCFSIKTLHPPRWLADQADQCCIPQFEIKP